MWSLLRSVGLRAGRALKTSAAKTKEAQWGGWAFIALFVSITSGIIVALQYEEATPFFSTASIDLLIPYGRFIRSLHFYSSQSFFFLTVIHLCFAYKSADKYSRGEWIRLTATLPIIILLLFTGYILRGDTTGISAGMIAENIVLTIPFLGAVINDLFFSFDEVGMRRVYIHHVITLDVLFLMLVWNHLKIYRVKIRNHLIILIFLHLLSVYVSAPLDPEQLGTTYIAGPWFFLGLQELLRYFSPLLAGVFIPSIFVALIFLAHPNKNITKNSFYLFTVFAYLVAYALLSVIAWNR